MSRNRHDKSDGLEARGHRHERLRQIVREEVAALLRDECVDPRLGDVRVTRVDLSVDYKNAKVGFVLPKDRTPEDRRRAEDALARAASFLRGRLGEAIDAKVVPALRFVWDRDAFEAPSD